MRVHDLTVAADLRFPELKIISEKASQFASDITIEFYKKDGGFNVVDVKSLLGMMLMPIYKETRITIKTKGSDEKEAIDFICDLIESFK